MRKLAVGIFCGALILGVGTVVFAAGNSSNEKNQSYEEMLPYMEKMHPDFSSEDMEEMYNDCHSNEGMMNKSTKEDITVEGESLNL
ncbi:MAG: hypothetical protein AB2421_14785 [Thermotaleaceae bacterium]|jgi:hypothetical protein